MKRDPWVRAWFSRDWCSDDGYEAMLLFLPCRSLMRRDEEGRMILVGFGVRARFLHPWGPFGYRHRFYAPPGCVPEWKGWRWPLRVEFHTDAAEIAFRRAEGAGHRFPGRRQPEPLYDEIYPGDREIPF